RTPFYVLVILAAMVGAFAEPLYDEGLMLWFYAPGMWSHFSAFGIPQPNWTHSGYAVLYGSAAMLIARQIHAGALTRNGLYAWAGVEFAMSCTFEMVGINGGAYEYWGPHVLRIFNYPVIIGILEACQVMCFAVAAAELRRRTSQPAALLTLFAIFPMTFYFANFGAGAPVIIALHLDTPSPTLVVLATLASIAFAVAAIHMAASLAAAPARAVAGGRIGASAAVAL
ncbi:hypothetical protein, partial [Sphingobium sp.]|uniref:hypothetical protein n=1 Tax=Sphingobium sp. TaxID=1912891 RepID=UPI002C1D18EB